MLEMSGAQRHALPLRRQIKRAAYRSQRGCRSRTRQNRQRFLPPPRDRPLCAGRRGNILSTGDGWTGLGRKTSVVSAGVALVADRNTQWLYYMPGDISHIPFHGVDVLTGKMSGCPLVVFRFAGIVHAGHIGARDGDPVGNAAVLATWNIRTLSKRLCPTT